MLESIILTTGEIFWHLASAGLAADAVHNAIHENYKLAVSEGLVSAYIQFSEYLERKTLRKIDELSNTIKEFSDTIRNEYLPQLDAMNEKLSKL